MVCLAATTFTSCSDDDDNNGSSTSNAIPMATVKTIVAGSESAFSSNFSLSDFNSGFLLLKYFNENYATFTRENDSTQVPLYNLLNFISGATSGDISGFPNLLSTIANVSGTYKADTLNDEWVSVADSDNSPHLKLLFTDGSGNDCSAEMKWVNDEERSDSITISTSSESVKVKLPNVIIIALTQGGTTVLSGKSNFDYVEATKSLSGVIRLTDKNGYGLSSYMTLANNILSGVASVVHNGMTIIGANATVNGTNFINHIVDNSVPMTTTGANINVTMLNGVNLVLSISDISAWGKRVLEINNIDKLTSTDVDSLTSVCNKYVKRLILVNNRPVATLQFLSRQTPTWDAIFGYLDSQVFFYSGENCMLNELFTGGERGIFVNLLSGLWNDYINLMPTEDVPE